LGIRQPWGGFQKASWASTKEASQLSITLDNKFQFNDAYMEKLLSLEKDFIQGCMDFTWAGGIALTFEICVFEKDTNGQKNLNMSKKSLSFLSES
jgi:hypothetical protein